MARNNTWTIIGRDKNGRQVGPYMMRGPVEVESARRIGQQIFDAQRQRAIATGADDPLILVESCDAAGNSESDFGKFFPPNAKPIDLNRYANKNAAGEPLLPVGD